MKIRKEKSVRTRCHCRLISVNLLLPCFVNLDDARSGPRALNEYQRGCNTSYGPTCAAGQKSFETCLLNWWPWGVFSFSPTCKSGHLFWQSIEQQWQLAPSWPPVGLQFTLNLWWHRQKGVKKANRVRGRGSIFIHWNGYRIIALLFLIRSQGGIK